MSNSIKKYLLLITLSSLVYCQPGKLNIGFDIDDTVLYSEDAFQSYVKKNGYPIDYGWINQNDKNYSLPITPTIDLIHFFKSKGHNVYFITARQGENGKDLAEYLTTELGYNITKDVNLFFMPKEKIGDQRFTTKHRKMKELDLDLFYGDSDSDIIAALKASVHPVRVVRNMASIDAYPDNYFGDVTKGDVKNAPFDKKDLKKFYKSSVGVFGESIYPIDWKGPSKKKN
jgi:acid phosphatase class B|tara:strand:- start:3717 stop:4403 length:687 start_codon:yes stop_codon:yes gene_type:complete